MDSSVSYPILTNQLYQKARIKRSIVVIAVFILFAHPATHLLIKQALVDAFYQVAVFVAGTLFLFHQFSRYIPQKIKQSYCDHPYLSIPFAAFMGALPGCGGAIVIVTQYTQQKASFAALVTVLIATMGDAAFLLLATEPKTALLVLSVSICTAIATGFFIRLFHEDNFLIPEQTNTSFIVKSPPSSVKQHYAAIFWQFVLIPSLLIGLLSALQIDIAAYSETISFITQWFAVFACGFILINWSFSNNNEPLINTSPLNAPKQVWPKVVADTHFVTTWVIVAFISYELMVNFLGLDLANWLQHGVLFVPLICAIIGLLPGCGPQILVTSLYLQGIIPISGLISNAISNDGDALFPAIALAPKAALVASIYSTVPALFIGYGFYFFY